MIGQAQQPVRADLQHTSQRDQRLDGGQIGPLFELAYRTRRNLQELCQVALGPSMPDSSRHQLVGKNFFQCHALAP